MSGRVTYLSLGSNLKEREKNLLNAISLIRKRYVVLDYSSIYLTSPIGYKNQPYFLNMVIKTDTGNDSPLEILEFIKSIEKIIGREKIFRWGPRLIDIDIIYIEDVNLESQDLIIPHRELFNRNFVLIPLSELTDFLIINGKSTVLKKYIDINSAFSDEVKLYRNKSCLNFS